MAILSGLFIVLVLLIVAIIACAMVGCGGYDRVSFAFLGFLGVMALTIPVGILIM